MGFHWRDDEELFSLIRQHLFTAVVGDIMDRLGFHRQFLPPQIRPLDPSMIVLGRAMTVLEADWLDGGPVQSNSALTHKPFGLMLEALDDLRRNEIYVCSGGSPTFALWGELMSTRAMKLGAAGAVVNGYSRDTRGILRLKFPTFSYGPYAQDQAPRGKVIDFRVPLDIGNVRVNSGDIVFGDIDGVCVIPCAAEEEVFRKAIEKVNGEETVRIAIEGGMSAAAAFEKYAIM